MSLEEELLERWEAGVKEHRPFGGEFEGNPMLELRDELLDSINYTREAARQKMIYPLESRILQGILKTILETLDSILQHDYATAVAEVDNEATKQADSS